LQARNAGNKCSAIGEIEVVCADIDCRARDVVGLILERPGSVNDEIRL
jgi:hypothetical protein